VWFFALLVNREFHVTDSTFKLMHQQAKVAESMAKIKDSKFAQQILS